MKKFIATVVKGSERGRVLGFPTINLEVESKGRDVLDDGVYACWVKVEMSDYMGAASFGPRPTFGLKDRKMEIFLIDFSGDLYGKKVEVKVYNKLRDIRRFRTPDELRAQIGFDVQQAIKALQKVKHYQRRND